MWKKIIIAILFIAVIAAGGYGTYHFYNENKATASHLTQMTSQRDNLQAQLNQIGTMTTTVAFTTNLQSGDEIKAEYIKDVYVPQSAISSSGYDIGIDASKKDALIGRKVRCNVSSGTIITEDMLMTDTEEVTGLLHYPVELTFDSLPVTLMAGDIVDLRYLIANGEEYVVFDHKEVMAIYGNTITFHITEEENAIINSLYSDLGVYGNVSRAYLFKYLEPGNKQTLSFYPVVTEMENFLLYNPNITDITRCVNTNLRDHINEQLLMLSNSANSGTAGQVMSSVSASLSGQSQARSMWLTEQKQKEQMGAQEVENQTTEETAESVDLEAIE